MTATASLTDAARRKLAALGTRLIGPGDSGYDDARAVHNAMINRHPALIVRCLNPDEVARTIAVAREHGAPIAVRGGGHNGGGLGVVDDGVVIDLSGMNEITIDDESQTISVGGGCTWGQVDRVTAEHGCVVPSGVISTTG